MLNDLYIELDTFLNRFEVRPKGSYAAFLGSGCSVQSGIPTGGRLVWEFKRRLYCSHHKVSAESLRDLESSENQLTIQNFIQDKKLTPAAGQSDYSYYFEKCFPTSEDRKYYIQTLVRDAVPSIGHRCLGRIFVEGQIDNVFTTNFDELIEAGIYKSKVGHSFLVLSPEKQHLLDNLSKSSLSRVTKLHGDYRYDSLQNTSEELKSLNNKLGDFVVETAKTKGILFCGYSGADESILSILESIVNERGHFPHGLVWCIRPGELPLDRVKQVISKSRETNEHSGFLIIDNFDELAYLLYSRTCSKDSEIEKDAKLIVNRKSAFQLSFAPPKIQPTILNALEFVDFPSTAYAVKSIDLKWQDLKSAASKPAVIASLYKRNLYMWGEIENISKFLKELSVNQVPTTIDLHSSKLAEDSSFYQGMLYDAILLFLEGRGLKRFRRTGVYDPQKKINGIYDALRKSSSALPKGYEAFEAVEYQLSWAEGDLRLILGPTVYIKSDTPHERGKPDSIITELVNKIKSNRYNASYGSTLREWRNRLFPKTTETFNIGEFSFTIKASFAFAGYPQTDGTYFFKRLKYFEEPKVYFDPNDIDSAAAHPLKGMLEFGPYENNLSTSSSAIRLALVTSSNHFDEIKRHLDSLNSEVSSTKQNEQYLINYPGFAQVFKSPLDVPVTPTEPRTCLINSRDIVGHSCVEFYDVLKKCIDNVAVNKHLFDVLVIYVPDEWVRFRELKNDSIYFDLHDSVKMYGAKKGIKVQFIERKSLDYPEQARVKWWLAQGLYVKGAGIPWKIEPTVPNTAYIGLGYALRDGKTLLAASQLFDERGQGLRVLLQPIRQHVMIGKNPFMSKSDARRLITTLREAYFSSGANSKLDRLVIHKSNFFSRDEIEGITQALDGVRNVELIQIQENTLWRGLRWNCEFSEGKWHNRDSGNPYFNFPIQRGTAVQIDEFSALLWTDGSVQHQELNNPRFNYYQSQRGIPSPLLIKRFHGVDPVEVTLQDILRLTKMNWNSGQLYKRLPVTIEFSKILAEMAKQSEQLNGTHAYDFRYFI